MANTHCKFHPTVDAAHRCDLCGVSFCNECTNDPIQSRASDQQHRCFICEGSLITTGEVRSIEPFWRVLDKIYRYPFTRPSSIAVILITAVLSALFKNSLLLLLVPSIMIIHYCFACLRETAQGSMRAPDFEQSLSGSIAPIFYVYIAMIIAAFLTFTVTGMLGEAFGVLFGLFCITVLPASVIVIAITEKLFPALAPDRLIGIVMKTGSAYFVMIAFVLIMTSSVALLTAFMGESALSGVGLFIQSMISNYYAIVMFHIMGYLVYQYHEALDFSPKMASHTTQVRSPEQRRNANIEVLIKAGKYGKAFKLCQQQARAEGNLWQWSRGFKVACAGANKKELEEYTTHYFKLLESQRRADELADAYVLAKRAQPSLEIKDTDLALKVAEELDNIGRPKYVVVLLRELHKHCKDRSKLKEAFTRLAAAYGAIPGEEKSAIFYAQQAKNMDTPHAVT